MARYRVAIETHETAGWYKAEVAEGPEFVRDVANVGFAETERAAYGEVAQRLRRHFAGRHTFEFIHAST